MTIQELLNYTLEKKASDLHLVVGSLPMVRIDGELVSVAGTQMLDHNQVEALMMGVVSDDQRQLLAVNKELDFSFALADRARFRVNIYFQKGTMAGSFRLVPKSIPSIEALGLPKICRDFSTLRQGFILVTGPTGQGKSTTIASILDEINRTRSVHIVTIEDPIEYVHTSARAVVSQREVHNDTHSWDVALRSILREDPDVVLIGEMRDYETIAAALTIAETGHLVFATLHTNSASQTIDRIVDVFPENQQPQIRLQLSANLEAVFSQRLVPVVSGGRIAAYEIMLGTPAVRAAIRDGRTHMLDNIIMTSSEYGMTSLEQVLGRLVREGKLTIDTARAYSLRPAEVARFAKGETR